MDWLWQGVLTNGLWWSFVVAGGAVIAIGKAKGWRWVTPILYGFAASALVLFIIVMAHMWKLFPLEQRITPKTAESNIRRWVDKFHLAVQALPDNPNEYFTLKVTTLSGKPLLIHQSKALENYLQMQAIISVSPEDQKFLTKLSAKEAGFLIGNLRVEMARARVGSFNIGLPLTTFAIVKSVPIVFLSESAFVQNIDEMELAEVIALETFRKELDARRGP
jgi:hypothetical protein